jgi:folylpolyglutamate synthase/dihydropteroate synthase
MRTARQFFAIIACILFPFACFAKDKKEDPRLKQVGKIFVAGNSASANALRKAFTDNKWKKVCVSSVTNKDDADAVLEIVESVPLGERANGTVRLPQSAATLTLTSGDMIWSDDSMYTAVFLLKRLNEAVCRAKK